MEHLLQVEGLTVQFALRHGARVVADNVSFFVDAGETVCLVGESGCGKSVTCLSLLGLLGRSGRVTGGKALFAGADLVHAPERALDAVRGAGIGMVFQDALSALDPVLSIGFQLEESICAHAKMPRAEAKKRAAALLCKVGLGDAAALLKKYPHQLSGGQRQRVMIAMALAGEPKLLIADEPTTALDSTVQAGIMALLKQLQRESGMGLLLVTHDLGLVAQNADRVLVMYAGEIVEAAEVHALFASPQHPYTRALLQSVPRFAAKELTAIPGSVPERYDAIEGCRFAARCPFAAPACTAPQTLRRVQPGHSVRCCGGQKGVAQ